MPLLREAQTNRPGFSKVPEGMYQFFPKHRPGWHAFWANMDGDLERIVGWAKDVGVHNPEDWYNALHQFLFNNFSGDVRLLRAATKEEKFHQFIAQTLENHVQAPKDKWWYIDKGTTFNGFVRLMERAAEIVDSQHAVEFINARVRNMGDEMYGEYLLGVAGKKAEVKEEADTLNRQAYEIEREVCPARFEPGDKVCYLLEPELDLTVIGMMDGSVLAERSTGALSYIEDVWNLKKA